MEGALVMAWLCELVSCCAGVGSVATWTGVEVGAWCCDDQLGYQGPDWSLFRRYCSTYCVESVYNSM